MSRNGRKTRPKWSDVKPRVRSLEAAELVNLIRDLYRLSEDNRSFLHARFGIGEDPLAPYKAIIEASLYPDVMRDRPIRIRDAERAISHYSRAVDTSPGLLELMVYFVEEGNAFAVDFVDIGEPFYEALLRMYDKAIACLLKQDSTIIRSYLPRLRAIVDSSSDIGWGYHDALSDLYGRYLSAYEDEETEQVGGAH